MTDKQYHPIHSHCMLHPSMQTEDKDPHQIVLATKSHVWVISSVHEQNLALYIVQDPHGNRFDMDSGACIASIPLALVEAFYTAEEAAAIVEAMAADDQLLSYAI